MELKQYFQIVRRWAWLLILGLILGAGGGYMASRLQEPVYQATTRALVIRASQDKSSDLTYISDQQLVQTYIQLLSTQPILDGASERLGYEVVKSQISVQQSRDTQIIAVTVEDHDPQRAPAIANVLLQVLIEQNETLQVGRYASTEENIQAQITQVESQISNIQLEVDQISTKNFQDQLREVETQIQPLQDEVSTLQQEIAFLSPAYSQERKSQIAEKQARINQIQPLLNLYQQIYSNLVVLGKPVDSASNTSSRLVQLQSTLGLYQTLYINLLTSLESVRLARLQNTPNIVQIEAASVPVEPIRPRPLTNTALATAVGLMLAAGIVFLIEYLDDTLKTPEDVERALGVPVLGFVAEMQYKFRKKSAEEVYVSRQPRSPVSEAFRSLRTNLEFAAVQKPIRTILITSPGPSEGKTTIAVNLAAIFAQAEKRVALLDADMRRPRVHRLLGMSNREGLSNVFLNKSRANAVGRSRDDLPHLMVITSGSLPPNPAELLGSEKMNQILDELLGSVDVVVIDTPPSLVADAQVLAAKVDAVLIVIQPGVTHIETARASLEMFKRAGARVVGVVMNRIPRNRSYYYGGYKYYSAYKDGKGYFSEKAVSPAEEPVKNHVEVSAQQNPVDTSEGYPESHLKESPPTTSYLTGLFEKLNELPPADPEEVDARE
jgi:capsular exopolysaccharide synthesis family protein